MLYDCNEAGAISRPVSAEVRNAFVYIYPALKKSRYDEEALAAVLEMLILGVNPDSLMQELPVLTKLPSAKDPLAISASDMVSLQAKLKAIRKTSLPSVDDVKRKLKPYVSDNGQSARQGLSTGLHAGMKSVIQDIPGFVGLKPSSLPTFSNMGGVTGTGLITILTSSNSLASVTMVSKSSTIPSGSVPPTSKTGGSLSAAVRDSTEDQTGFERLVESMDGVTSNAAVFSQLQSLTANRNRSLFFTEDSEIKLPPEPLKVAATSFLSSVRDRVPVPAKFIESMYILNELVLLFVEYFKIVFQAFPSLFVGLAEKLDKAILVAPQVYGNPRSYLLLFELMVQLGAHDTSAMRILPYVIQEIIKVVDHPGTFNGGSSTFVAKVYS